MRRNAFTLIELLVVLAISAILLSIIAIPMVQGFNLTRDAQAFAAAQDRARVLVSRLEREIRNAAAVRDNSGLRGAIAVVVPDQSGNPVAINIQGAKLDLLEASHGDPNRGPSGALINPYTGKEDPTLVAPTGQMTLPATPGPTLVRYWVGLRDPVLDTDGDGVADRWGTYNNPYDRLLTPDATGRDNLYVMYRAEVQPLLYNAGAGQYEIDLRYFADADTNGVPDDIDDPAFFSMLPSEVVDPNNPASATHGQAIDAAAAAKMQRIYNWRSRATIVTDINRNDMIVPVYDKSSRSITYTASGVPELIPLIDFSAKAIVNEPADGQLAVRVGEETDNAEKVAPDIYHTDFGAWTKSFVSMYPGEWPSAWGHGAGETLAGLIRPDWQPGEPYLIGRPRVDAAGNQAGFSIFAYDPSSAQPPSTGGIELFDADLYSELVFQGAPNPFTAAVAAANSRSGWLGNPAAVELFVPLVPDVKGGRLIASFAVEESGSDPGWPANDRTPRAATGDANTPNNDPTVGAGVWHDRTTINQRFNKLWVDWPTLGMANFNRDEYVKRFIDLALVPLPDGTPSPLDPVNGFPRAQVVAGSETVIGPDQRPGPNYSSLIRYTRVNRRPVGVNEYFIQYVDQPEPNYAAVLGGEPANIYDPGFYDSTNLISAVIQRPYRAGYVEFNSAFGEPLPQGNIFISYHFQMSGAVDAVAVDYDTAEVMQINLTIRNYPPGTRPNPLAITVKGSAEVRNFIR